MQIVLVLLSLAVCTPFSSMIFNIFLSYFQLPIFSQWNRWRNWQNGCPKSRRRRKQFVIQKRSTSANRTIIKSTHPTFSSRFLLIRHSWFVLEKWLLSLRFVCSSGLKRWCGRWQICHRTYRLWLSLLQKPLLWPRWVLINFSFPLFTGCWEGFDLSKSSIG